MNLVDIWFALGFFCVAWHFYHQRKIAEIARHYIVTYCEKNSLQFISIAKVKSRLSNRPNSGLVWCNDYSFEFSGDGESSYQGSLVMHGTRIHDVDMPPYRI